MSRSYVVTRERTFTAGAALAQYRRVRLSAGVLAYAGAGDNDSIGVLTRDTFAAGEAVAVDLVSMQGTVPLIASGAISANAAVYAAANGKVAASGTVLVGWTFQAATADGDIIEVLLSPTAILGSIARSSFLQEDLAVYAYNLTQLRVHDALQTDLPGTASSDDLALIGGTFGTGSPTIQANDFGGSTLR